MAGGPEYNAEGQSSFPFFSQFQNTFKHINNGTYSYNCASPSLNTANLAPGTQNMPLYRNWNQDTNMPIFMGSQNESCYSNQNVYDSQSNRQFYQPTSDLGFMNNMIAGKYSKNSIISNSKPDNNNKLGQADIGKYHNDVQQSTFNGCQDFNKGYTSVSALNTDSTCPCHIQRQQSDSYSPCATPHPTNADSHAVDDSRISSLPTTKKQSLKRQVDCATSETPKQSFSAAHESKPNSIDQINMRGRSLSEYKRKAQNAILSLWPYGVRYQTYLREGFKKDLVEELFKDLKMQNHISFGPTDQIQHQKLAYEPTPSIPSESTKPSHQKDPNSTASQDSSNAVPSAPAPKPSQMAEKEKTLQSKMEALRKSREARASAKTVLKTNSEQDKEKSSLVNKNMPTNQETPLESLDNQPSTLDVQKNAESHAQSSPRISSNICSQSTIEPKIESCPQLTEPINVSSVQNKPPTKAPTIPGLFLVSNATSTMNTHADGSLIKQRKRPVASDFDDPNTTVAPFKRPFGHNCSEQRVVIDVSEDESEDEEDQMEFESQTAQKTPAVISIRMSGTPQATKSSSNSPAHKSSLAPNSGTNASSVAPKQSLLTPSILKQKQREIQLMKKKIAEAEAQLKAKSSTGSARTSQPPESSINEAKEDTNPTDVSVNKADNHATSCEAGDRKADPDQPLPTVSKDLTVTKSPHSNYKCAEEKSLRRKKIADELPKIEAEVQLGKSRIEQLRLEIAQVEAGLKRNLVARQRIANEMEWLSEEKDVASVSNVDPQVVCPLEVQTNNSSNIVELGNEDELTRSPRVIENSAIIFEKSSSTEPTMSCESTHRETGQTSPNTTPNRDFSPHKTENASHEISTTVSSQPNDNLLIENTTDRDLEEVLHVVISAEAGSEENTMKLEKENSHISEPINQSMMNDISMEEGELNSDYTPQLSTIEGPEGESDNYEPPDATAPDQMSSVLSPPFSPAPPEPIELSKDGQSQIINLNQTFQIDQRDVAIENQSHKNTSVSQQMVEVKKKASMVSFISFLLTGDQESILASHTPNRFTPYQSPLKIFHAYRFHPNFKIEVAGGLRSNTYSHKIDSQKEFCRFEIAGGVCNDSVCDLQHFRSITLPDDAIMAALGRPDEFTGERRENFIAGLREVLLGLRMRKVNDFDIIASEIVAHRAKFLGDQTKILGLEGTTI